MTEVRVHDDAQRLRVVGIDGTGAEIGSAWCLLDAGLTVHPAWVEVEPAERGHGLGAELLRTLIAEASTRGVAYLSVRHPDAVAARRMERDSGAICSRRVVGGETKDVIVVPRVA
jgi:GNAT superfamily N-acetyltransferase